MVGTYHDVSYSWDYPVHIHLPAGATVGILKQIVSDAKDHKWYQNQHNRENPLGVKLLCYLDYIEMREVIKPGNEVGSERAERWPHMDRQRSLLHHLGGEKNKEFFSCRYWDSHKHH